MMQLGGARSPHTEDRLPGKGGVSLPGRLPYLRRRKVRAGVSVSLAPRPSLAAAKAHHHPIQILLSFSLEARPTPNL